METSLVFGNQAYKVFFGEFQDNLNRFLHGNREHAYVAYIIALKTGAVFRNLSYYPLLIILTGENFKLLVYLEN